MAFRSARVVSKMAPCLWLAALLVSLTVFPGQGRASSLPAPLQELHELMEAVCRPASPAPPEGDWRVTPEFCSLSPVMIRLGRGDGTAFEMAALLAGTGAQRQAGYQHIGTDVIARTAILFVFPQPVQGAFHMCNVPAALDIAWFDAQGALVDLTRMEPGPVQAPWLCSTLYSPGSTTPYRFALEVPAGFFARHGLGPALRLEKVY